MLKSTIIAGAGGQGNIFIGEILCRAAIREDKRVTLYSSYGPQMRGGKSTCAIVISDKEIGSPIIKHPDFLIVMNGPSLDFLNDLKKGGCAIINQSLAKYNGKPDDIDIVLVETSPIIEDLKNNKVLNMILLGVYLKKTKIIENMDNILAGLNEALDVKAREGNLRLDSKEKIFDINKEALSRGYNLIL